MRGHLGILLMSHLWQIKPGFMMNIMCVGVELFLINTWGRLVFDLDTFPDWAMKNQTSINYFRP